ncbi:uncharacterized protein LOC144133899 [Amblyomma americanum]
MAPTSVFAVICGVVALVEVNGWVDWVETDPNSDPQYPQLVQHAIERYPLVLDTHYGMMTKLLTVKERIGEPTLYQFVFVAGPTNCTAARDTFSRTSCQLQRETPTHRCTAVLEDNLQEHTRRVWELVCEYLINI